MSTTRQQQLMNAAYAVKNIAVSTASAAATGLVHHVQELRHPNTPSFKSSATASAAFALASAISYCESGGSWTTLLATTGMLFEGAITVQQCGGLQEAGMKLAGSLLGFLNPPIKAPVADASNVNSAGAGPAKKLT